MLDAEQRVLAASPVALEALPALELGDPVPARLLGPEEGAPLLLYLGEPAELAAYEELRSGFTAAVSHELRTPLARLLVLLESTLLPDAEVPELVEAARAEIDQVRELIDDVLFLSELETGREVVALGSSPARPILEEVASKTAERAERADVRVHVAADPDVLLPLRPRMIRMVLENLFENALRYAGPRTRLTVSIRREGDEILLVAADDGAGVAAGDLPRLFERFYRADRARASHGTGLGLAIVKHVVTAAGGTVAASGGPGRGLEIRCVFPA